VYIKSVVVACGVSAVHAVVHYRRTQPHRCYIKVLHQVSH